MGNNKGFVTVGKPEELGAVYRAPVGTPYPIPADDTPLAYAAAALEELDPAFDESDEFEDFVTLYGPGAEPDNEASSWEVLYGPSIREPNDRWMDDDFIEIKVPKESKKTKDNGKK